MNKYHVKTFNNQFGYTTVNYVDSASYGIMDMHTTQMVIDFDDKYTQLSCDSQTGNYF